MAHISRIRRQKELTAHKELFPYLPIEDQRLLRFYLQEKCSQASLAAKFNTPQSTIHYRLTRIAKRLEFLKYFPILSKTELEKLFHSIGVDSKTVQMMAALYLTTSQASAAKEVGCGLSVIAYNQRKTIALLHKLVAAGAWDYEPLLRGMLMIKDNYKLLCKPQREAIRNVWADKTLDQMKDIILEHFYGTGNWPSSKTSLKFRSLAETLRKYRGTSLSKLVEELGGPKARPTILYVGLSPEKRKLIKFLPKTEQDMIRAYYIKGLKQEQISLKHDMTQAAVSYRLKTAHKRLEFLLKFPILERDEITRVLESADFLPESIQILIALYETTSQSATAKRLGVSQGKVRWHLHNAIKTLEPLVASGREDLKDVLLGLTMVRDWSGALHSYPHSKFSRG